MEEIPENKWLTLPEDVFAMILSSLPNTPEHKALSETCRALFVRTYQHSLRFHYLLASPLQILLSVLVANDPEDTCFPEAKRKKLYSGLAKTPDVITMEIKTTHFLHDLTLAEETNTLETFIRNNRGECRAQYRDDQENPSLEPDDATLFAFMATQAAQYSSRKLKIRCEKIEEVKQLIAPLIPKFTFWQIAPTALSTPTPDPLLPHHEPPTPH